MGRRNRIPQKKSLGQVFLNTEWPVRRVATALRQWNVQNVLEVGPGGGVLTRELLAHGLQVTAVEKDPRWAERLRDFYRVHSNDFSGQLEVVEEDVLKFDLAAWIQRQPARTAVVGNIPYYISTPILSWMLPHLSRLAGSFLLVQLEFAMRLAGQAGTKAYGSLSVFTQLRAQVSLDCKVDRACFTPVPNVDSALVMLKPKAKIQPESVLQKVEAVTRASFTQRRKMLRNAIRQFLSDELADACPIDLNRRPDSLRPEEYVELAKYIFPKDEPKA